MAIDIKFFLEAGWKMKRNCSFKEMLRALISQGKQRTEGGMRGAKPKRNNEELIC
jgi:hypothetical protein